MVLADSLGEIVDALSQRQGLGDCPFPAVATITQIGDRRESSVSSGSAVGGCAAGGVIYLADLSGAPGCLEACQARIKPALWRFGAESRERVGSR